ncbi:hypothetical protein ASE37_24260 [Rhizobium sp. Root268]|nr:hypothetical protein ASC86_24495 [Rhizobium sp. Root1212]KRD28652.1 hypothetical protein ASE37_24260 [Rhizobium sp. Root268]
MTESAISQHIRRAEQRLGTRLFVRLSSGLIPTEILATTLPLLAVGFENLAEAAARLQPARQRALGITVGNVFAGRFLIPRMPDFAQRHTGIDLNLEINGFVTDLSRSEIDCGIRFGAGKWPLVKSRKLSSCSLLVVCSPEFAAKVRRPEDIRHLPIIRDSSTEADWPNWLRAAKLESLFPLNFLSSYADPSISFEAAINSHGLLLAVDILAAEAVMRGDLVSPLPIRLESASQYWLVSAEGRQQTENQRIFENWLMRQARQAKVLTEGG